MYKPSEMKSKGTMKCGDTLFIDGVPYRSCGRCGGVIKSDCGTKEVIAGRGTKQVVVKPYKITILLKWLQIEEYVIQGNESVLKIRNKPLVKSVQSCFDCWNIYQQEVANCKSTGRMAYIKEGE